MLKSKFLFQETPKAYTKIDFDLKFEIIKEKL